MLIWINITEHQFWYLFILVNNYEYEYHYMIKKLVVYMCFSTIKKEYTRDRPIE